MDGELTIVSGHQPSYLPWLGFFHKLNLCDKYVFMDTVQFEENGWLHRNRVRMPNGWSWLTVPIDHNASNKQRLNEVYPIGVNEENKESWQDEHWETIRHLYANAEYYDEYAPELRRLYKDKTWESLVELCWEQLQLFSKWLELDDREVVRMSDRDFEGTKDDLVLDHAKKLSGDAVVFGSNGEDYVDVEKFNKENISVYFQDYQHPNYNQRFDGFESHMSIVDLIFNHGPDAKQIIFEDNIRREDLKNGSYWVNG